MLLCFGFCLLRYLLWFAVCCSFELWFGLVLVGCCISGCFVSVNCWSWLGYVVGGRFAVTIDFCWLFIVVVFYVWLADYLCVFGLFILLLTVVWLVLFWLGCLWWLLGDNVDGLLVDEFAFCWGCCFTLFVVLKLLEFFVSVWLVSRLFVIGLFIDLLVCYLLWFVIGL